LLRFYICAYVCICMCMYMCVHVCVYTCMCICMYMHICTSVYMDAYTFIYARVWVYICTRVGAFCLFVLSYLSITCVQSLYYMRVYYRCFLTLACVCGGGLEVGFVSACSWLALVTGVGGYVLAGVERYGFCLVYFSIFAGVRVVGGCVLVHARTHT